MAKKSTESVSDVVVFMTAFHFHKMNVRKRRLLPRRKKQILSEMKEHHIEAVLYEDVVLSQLGRMDFDAVYDKLSQNTTIKFSKEEMGKDSHNGIWAQMEWAFKLKNEMSILFDNDILKPSFFYRLEPFRVVLQERTMEVWSIAFMLTNGIWCTAFSLYDCKKKQFIASHEVCGRSHHFHLFDISCISYDGEKWIDIEKSSISDIIIKQVGRFNLSALNLDFIQNNFTYYHSMLIMSNEINDYEEYVHDLVGVDILPMPLQNICPTKECEYFSQECFGIVSAYDDKDFEHLLYRHIALESLKLYYFVNLFVSYEQTTSLSKTYQQVLQLDILEHMMNTPLLTTEVLNNIRQLSSYARLKEAMEFKITYLNTQQEERKNQNATLLNLLLYVLTLVSTVGTVYDLAKEFTWPIPWVLTIVIVFFAFGGACWYKREKDKH